MSFRISLKSSDLFLGHLKLEEELNRLGDPEGVAVIEAFRLDPGLHHNLPGRVHISADRSYCAN